MYRLFNKNNSNTVSEVIQVIHTSCSWLSATASFSMVTTGRNGPAVKPGAFTSILIKIVLTVCARKIQGKIARSSLPFPETSIPA